MHQGNPVVPELQPLTMHKGTISPRSPRAFQLETQSSAPSQLLVNLASGQTTDVRSIDLPEATSFLNVDRAMNMYLSSSNGRDNLGPNEREIWRVQPGTEQGGNARVVGGVHLKANCSAISWRTLYVDQAGAAWTMCVTPQSTVFTRYDLFDTAGAPLPVAATTAPEVSWRPSSTAALVKG